MNGSYSNFLFSVPGFISGASRVIDIAGTFDVYNTSPNESMADYMAIKSDWKTIANDLRNAIIETVYSK